MEELLQPIGSGIRVVGIEGDGGIDTAIEGAPQDALSSATPLAVTLDERTPQVLLAGISNHDDDARRQLADQWFTNNDYKCARVDSTEIKDCAVGDATSQPKPNEITIDVFAKEPNSTGTRYKLHTHPGMMWTEVLEIISSKSGVDISAFACYK